jgi:hypothetical protein
MVMVPELVMAPKLSMPVPPVFLTLIVPELVMPELVAVL